MRTIPVTNSRAKDIEQLFAVTNVQWDELLEKLQRQTTAMLTVDELAAVLASVVGESSGETLSKIVVSLRRLADRYGVRPQTILDALEQGLKKFEWNTDKLDKWSKIKNPIDQIMSSAAVVVTTKASELYYRHANHLHDLKIVTDIRPIFSEDRSAVIGAITKNVLSIHFSDSFEKESSLELVISLDDLANLQAESASAIAKTEKLKTLVVDKLGIQNRPFNPEW